MTIPHWLPQAPPIQAHQLHIWRLQLDAPKQDNLLIKKKNLLNLEEVERAERFYFEVHQRRFIFARAGLREILGHYLSLTPAELEFAYARHGKPYLSQYPNLQFNISHSKHIALVAVRLDSPIGIDIEFFKKRDLIGLARHSFSALECQQLEALSAAEMYTSFYHIWSQKEAFIKAKGRGLNYPLKQFSVSAKPPAQLLEVPQDEHQDWFCLSFQPTPLAWACVTTVKPVTGVEFIEHTNGEIID